MTDLVVTAEGPVRLIELNRPKQRKRGQPDAAHRALAGVWDRLAADDEVRAVVLTGRGRPFTAAITGTGQRTIAVMMRRASSMLRSRNASSRCTRVIT